MSFSFKKSWNKWWKEFYELIKESAKTIIHRPCCLLLSALFDFLFLFVFFMIFGVIEMIVMNNLVELLSLVGDSTGGLLNVLTFQNSTQASSLASNSQFTQLFGAIVFYVFLAIIVFVVCFLIIENFAWYFSYKATKQVEKKSEKSEKKNKNRLSVFYHWKNFVLQSLPFLIITFLWIYYSLKSYITARVTSTAIISGGLWYYIFIIGLVVIWYFGFLALSFTDKISLINLKNTFVIGIRKFLRIIPSIIFILVLAFIIDLILKIPFLVNQQLIFAIVGVVLVLGLFFYARVLLFKTVEKIAGRR